MVARSLFGCICQCSFSTLISDYSGVIRLGIDVRNGRRFSWWRVSSPVIPCELLLYLGRVAEWAQTGRSYNFRFLRKQIANRSPKYHLHEHRQGHQHSLFSRLPFNGFLRRSFAKFRNTSSTFSMTPFLYFPLVSIAFAL